MTARLDNELQPLAAHPLAPAQTAIRYCLANVDGFCAWAKKAYGADYPPGFFDDADATVDDLIESHNAIGRLIDEAVNR